MKAISKILAVIDPTTADQPGVSRASWLAKETGAELELLVCYYNEYLSGDRLFDSPSLEKARDEVDHVAYVYYDDGSGGYDHMHSVLEAVYIHDKPLVPSELSILPEGLILSGGYCLANVEEGQ